MYKIKAENPSVAWLKATNYILENGRRRGSLKREVMDLIAEIKYPLQRERKIDETFKKYMGEKWIEKGANPIFPKNFEDTRSSDWSKTYWTRLKRFRDNTNQLDFIIKRLQNKPRSKQLFCVTFDPELDIQPHRPFNPTMPCLTALDFKFRNKTLGIFALFRSHDFGRKAYGNYLGLGRLLRYVSSEAKCDSGSIICYSRSAHIRSKEYSAIKKTVHQILEV